MSRQDDIKKFKDLSLKLDLSVMEELALLEEARSEEKKRKNREEELNIYSGSFLRNVIAVILFIILFYMIINQLA
ncbi:MAG: hypothetical protein AAF629_28265 [Chloroflexota bacterium]